MNVKLKRLLLPLLRAVKEGRPISFRMRSAASQALLLLGKPTAKKIAAKARQRIEKQSSRASHNQETGKLYRACDRRAGPTCECGCGRHFEGHPKQMDHFYGRGVVPQAVDNCWMLALACHLNKTANWPSREEWDGRFAAHCAKYGYELKPRIVKSLPAKAGGAP